MHGRVAVVHGNTCQMRESAKMSATKECLRVFVSEAGEQQPHRLVRRKVDGAVFTLVLLPMSTKKLEVFRYVNEEVKKMVDGIELSLSSFRRLWRTEFPHIQIPPYSRFSKCHHCWEYKCGMESTTNAVVKVKIKELYIIHIRLQMEERQDYWLFKRSAMITPDLFMCLIVDGMDQNTTMIPKMRQTVKNIESRFVKTHLCGVLVHGIGLYADVWIDAHHKHDSNQVITSVMNVICDVKRRKGFLPPTLRIQADNTTRENKNIYMFAMCAVVVGLGFFKEVHLCFLIVGHTHEDINQRFSVISNVLKRKDIDTLEEMLDLVEKWTSPIEAFVRARKLEYVRDWKAFITPHLEGGGKTLIGITFPQHMRFYVENGNVRVQYKHYSADDWGPAGGYSCLNSLPNVVDKPDIAEIFAANQRELKALDEFIAYKEKMVLRGFNRIMNMEVAKEIKVFKEYLEEFPQRSREGIRELPFWPSDVVHQSADANAVPIVEDGGTVPNTNSGAEGNGLDNASVDVIMATMPNPERRGYFGPRKNRPPQEASRRLTGGRRRGHRNEGLCGIVQSPTEDPFPPFNLENDVVVGQYVALTVELAEVREGVLFYVGKILGFGQGNRAQKMKVLWYWPVLRRATEDEACTSRVRYANCMESTWEPSGERLGWVDKEATIYSWMNVPRRGRSGNVMGSNITVRGVHTEGTMIIPTEAKPHLLEYMAMQMENLDDERLQNDLNMH